MRFLLFFAAASVCYGGTVDYSKISARDIARTADHLSALVHEAQAKTQQVQNAFDQEHTARVEETLRADKEAARADQWEHRTEVVVELFAFAFAFWLGSLTSGMILRNWPAPEGWIAVGAVYLAAFLMGMWVVNHFIDTLGRVIPTPPSWSQIERWSHHTAATVKKDLK